MSLQYGGKFFVCSELEPLALSTFFDPVWAPAHSVSLVCKTSPSLGTDWACDSKIKKIYVMYRILKTPPVECLASGFPHKGC